MKQLRLPFRRLVKFTPKSRTSSFGTMAAAQPKFQTMADNKEQYLSNLKLRLDESWAAGLSAFFTNSPNLVPKEEVVFVLDQALKVLDSEPNVINIDLNKKPQNLSSPEETMTVVGDTHGQYYDLLNILRLNGDPSHSNKYIFNGDFVDRGSFSFQTVFLLLTLKTLMPENVYLTRGNHETVNMNVMYGFFHEIIAKYDQEVMEKFWTIFSQLPLGCIVKNNRFPDYAALVLHGGLLTAEGVTIDEINSIDRTMALDEDSSSRSSEIMHDILWSDPMDQNGRQLNEARGGGLMFGPDVTESFLNRNNLNLLIRSHQVRRKGWSEQHNGKCVTVFSAPNYCDSTGNKGAYLKFTSTKPEPEVYEFEAVRHPPLGPMTHLEVFRSRM